MRTQYLRATECINHEVEYRTPPELDSIRARLAAAPQGLYVLDGVPEDARGWHTYSPTVLAYEQFRRAGYNPRIKMRGENVHPYQLFTPVEPAFGEDHVE